jgi:hypothetical protein
MNLPCLGGSFPKKEIYIQYKKRIILISIFRLNKLITLKH